MAFGLAAAFGRKVVAEGGETPEHGVMLAELGCDNVQGYGIARPMPIALFESWRLAFELDAAWQARPPWPGRD